MNQNTALFLFDVAAVLALGVLLALPMRRLRQPRVIAEILAGLALGPSLLGLFPGHLPQRLFPAPVQADLSAIAQVGILPFMFLVGWQLNVGSLRERAGSVLAVSLASAGLPFAAGAGLAVWLYHDHAVVHGKTIGEAAFVLFVGAAMAVTAFPVLARIILEHRLQLTSVGRLAIASAAVGDVLAWCLLAVVSVVAVAAGPRPLLRLLGWCALYAVVLVLVVRPLLRRLTRRGGVAGAAPIWLVPLIAAGAFAAGGTTSRFGIDAIFGAFTFGLVMPRDMDRALESAVRVPLEQIAQLLMPVFFVSAGLSVNVENLGASGLLQLAAIFAVACVGKLVGAGGAARLTGLDRRSALTVGLLMNTRGLTELIILNAGLTMGILDGRMFTMMVITALATTAMTGPLVPRLPYARAEIFAAGGDSVAADLDVADAGADADLAADADLGTASRAGRTGDGTAVN